MALRNHYKFFTVVFLLLLSFASSFSVTKAATLDRTAPTAPTSLHATGKTASSISLAWNKSRDNVGVTGYYVYKNNKFIGSTVSVKSTDLKLTPKTTYSFFIKARDARGNLSNPSNVIKVTTSALAIDNPPNVSAISVSPIASDHETVSGTVTLAVNATDDKGVSKVMFYSNNGASLIGTRTAAPYSVKWSTNSSANGSQFLKVVVYDTANHTVQVTRTIYVKNPVAPAQSVQSVQPVQLVQPVQPVQPVLPAQPAEPTYKTIGYYAGWSTYSNYQVANIDAGKLTELNYAFAGISSDGTIALGDPYADVEKVFSGDTAGQPYEGNFYQLTKLKQKYPNLKTLITVGGWNGSAKFSDVALTDQSRTTFANSCLQFILKYGFDGVDLDWEYPVGGGLPGNDNRPEDKHNFTLLVQKIRQTFDTQSAKDGKKYYLSIAGGAGQSYAADTELSQLGQYVDYIQLMTYDIHGEWESMTGLNAPLYRDPASGFGSDWSVQDTVQMYLNNGVPANKIIMGLPLYGRSYNQAGGSNNGLYQTFSGGTAISYAALEANYINKNGFIRYWDAASQVPWLFNGSQFISYDDVESIGYKTAFIKSMGLGGAMMWELSQDPNEVLVSKVYNDLN